MISFCPSRKKRRVHEEEDDGLDPVIIFTLSTCENIHQCLQLPSSPIQPGATPEHSYENLMTWIAQTVWQRQLYNAVVNDVVPGSVPLVQPPNKPANPPLQSIQLYDPLVFQQISHELQTEIVVAMQIGNWSTECQNARVSCGTLVLATKPIPSSSYITTALTPVGPFLAFGGL